MEKEKLKNPIISEVCRILDMEEDTDLIIAEFFDGIGKIKFYKLEEKSINSPYKIEEVSIRVFGGLLKSLFEDSDSTYPDVPDVIGTDAVSLYDSFTHRRANNIRIFFPSCILQVEYDDEFVCIEFSELICEDLRDKLYLVE